MEYGIQIPLHIPFVIPGENWVTKEEFSLEPKFLRHKLAPKIGMWALICKLYNDPYLELCPPGFTCFIPISDYNTF